jgi:hypothetical protein
MEFSKYDEVPRNVAQEIIKARGGAPAGEEEEA